MEGTLLFHFSKADRVDPDKLHPFEKGLVAIMLTGYALASAFGAKYLLENGKELGKSKQIGSMLIKSLSGSCLF